MITASFEVTREDAFALGWHYYATAGLLRKGIRTTRLSFAFMFGAFGLIALSSGSRFFEFGIVSIILGVVFVILT